MNRIEQSWQLFPKKVETLLLKLNWKYNQHVFIEVLQWKYCLGTVGNENLYMK